MRSLDEIILAQRDEPRQRNCIYLLRKESETSDELSEEKYFQIRVASIDFLQKPATAVYFYDLTKHFKSY